MKNIFNKLFRKKKDLREECRKVYGDEFIRMYDDICRGVPIGNLSDTIEFLEMVEDVKRKIRSENES